MCLGRAHCRHGRNRLDLAGDGIAGRQGIVSSNTPTAPAAQVSPTSSPYAVRQINLTFKIGTGPFGEVASSTFTVTGLRVIAHIEQTLNPMMQSSLAMKVYGLSLDHMNALSVAGLLYTTRDNQVLVQAGDSDAGLTTVFNGAITQAFPALDTAEDAHFFVQGSPSSLAALKPVSPTSYPGGVSAASAIQAAATLAGFSFQNNGVTAVLQSPYFPGTAWQQIQSAVKAANCYAYLDDTTNTFKIWPKNGSVTVPGATVVISPQTGMIGYPRFQKRFIK